MTTLTGKDLATVRAIARVEGRELARELRCSPVTVWKIENKTAYPQPVTVHRYLVGVAAIHERRLAERSSLLAIVRHFDGADADLVRQIIATA